MSAFVPFSTYGADERPHPAAVDESQTLAAVWPRELPDVTNLVIDSTVLSSLQLETVALIRAAFSRNRGFLLGDSTGLGKGRMCAATILDTVVRGCGGRARGLWVSTSAALFQDARRDVEAVDTHSHLKWDVNIRFCTYGQLGNNIHEYTGWLLDGGAESVLVLDEVHAANNAETKTAQTVCAVQRCLPQTSVLYSTATSASKLDHLSFLHRLRLWGPGAGFETFDTFEAHLKRFACSAAELLAVHMKREGMFVSRAVSMRGVDVQLERCRLNLAQRQLYDECARRWADAPTTAGGDRQRFFLSLITALKVPVAVAIARRAIEAGMSVVLAVQGTGEANSQRTKSRAQAKTGDILPLGPPSKLRSLMSAAGLHHADLALPLDPIDAIIEAFGADGVAELTGRVTRAVPSHGQWRWAGKPSINSERAAFQNDERRVAVLSRAGSTGISLHADRPDSRPRKHVTIELPWSCETLVQQCGRSHRAGQSSLPEYVLLVTDVPAELRFVSTVAGRLQQLGALKHGDRRTAASQGGEELLRMHLESGITMTCLRRAALAILVVAIIRRLGWTAPIHHGTIDYALLRQNAAKAGTHSSGYTVRMAYRHASTLWRKLLEGGAGRFMLSDNSKQFAKLAATLVSAISAVRFAVLREGLLEKKGVVLSPTWTPATHRYYPWTFKQAARALMLGAQSPETGETLGKLTHDVKYSILERMAHGWPAPDSEMLEILSDTEARALGSVSLDQLLNSALCMELGRQVRLISAIGSCRLPEDALPSDGVQSIERVVLPASTARESEFVVHVEAAEVDTKADLLHVPVRVEAVFPPTDQLRLWREAGTLVRVFYMLNGHLAAAVSASDNPACVDIWQPGRVHRTKRLTHDQYDYDCQLQAGRAAEARVTLRVFGPEDPTPDHAWEGQSKTSQARVLREARDRSVICTFVHRNPLVSLDNLDEARVVRVERPDFRFTGLLLRTAPYHPTGLVAHSHKKRKTSDSTDDN